MASSAASPSWAEPQGNASWTIGGAAAGEDGEFWDHAEFHMGVHGDVLFARDDAYDFGIGPYAEVGTFAFDEFQFGGGASLLCPVDASYPLVVSLGAYGRAGDDDFGLEPGIAASIFWGSRSFNFHSNYVMVAGVQLGFRQSLGESYESLLALTLHLDLAFTGLPLVALFDLMRGPSDETAPIEPTIQEEGEEQNCRAGECG